MIWGKTGTCINLCFLVIGIWSIGHCPAFDSTAEGINLVSNGGFTCPEPLFRKEDIAGNGLFWTAVGYGLLSVCLVIGIWSEEGFRFSTSNLEPPL